MLPKNLVKIPRNHLILMGMFRLSLIHEIFYLDILVVLTIYYRWSKFTPYSSGDNYLNNISLAKLSIKKYIAFVKVMNTLNNSSFTCIVKFIRNETNN